MGKMIDYAKAAIATIRIYEERMTRDKNDPNPRPEINYPHVIDSMNGTEIIYEITGERTIFGGCRLGHDADQFFNIYTLDQDHQICLEVLSSIRGDMNYPLSIKIFNLKEDTNTLGERLKENPCLCSREEWKILFPKYLYPTNSQSHGQMSLFQQPCPD